ncbi:MAG: hypothetical protein QM699_01375 [Amaricoccus sp.]|uniref:hypothetical protein n=1 Tax=Amaricoccus sp. TaxID=1872485 RepID=UPI0039E4C54F
MIRLTRATALLVAATALSGHAALARDLTVVSFGGALQDAQREALFKPFIAEHGPMTDEAYNGELAKIKAMVEANDVTWDVVQMEAPEARERLFRRHGRAARLGQARRHQGHHPRRGDGRLRNRLDPLFGRPRL